MRPAEIVTVMLVVVWAVLGQQRITPRWTVAALAAVIVLGTAAVGPWRWQLWPLAVAVTTCVVVSIVPLLRDGATLPLPRTTAIIVVVLSLLSALLAWALPIPSFPLEDGSSAVGTVAFDLVAPTRSSISTTVPSTQPRGVTVQAWYPTDARSGERLRATDDGPAFGSAVGGFIGVPGFVLRHLDQVRMSARVDAPPSAEGRLPVVLSLHGWGGFRFAQAPLLEQLAADGHLVLAIDHTHGAVAAQPASGGVVAIDPTLLPNDVPQDEYDRASTALERMFTDDAFTLIDAVRDGDVQVPQAVLELADLDRLIVIGHSTGGGAGLWFCAESDRCRGFIGYDPWVEPLPEEVRASGPTVPWLAIGSGEWSANDNHALLTPMVERDPSARWLTIDGTLHRDFTVQSMLSPVADLLGLAGEVDAGRAQEITLALTRAFIADVLGTGPGDPLEIDDARFSELSRP